MTTYLVIISNNYNSIIYKSISREGYLTNLKKICITYILSHFFSSILCIFRLNFFHYKSIIHDFDFFIVSFIEQNLKRIFKNLRHNK